MVHNLYYILQKEFRLIFRNSTILRLIFVMPVLQLLLIPFAADYEVKHVSIAVIDQDHTSASRRLLHKIEASNYFSIVAAPPTYNEALQLFEAGATDIVLTVPHRFEHDLMTTGSASMQLVADAVNGVRAGLGTNYAIAMVHDFYREAMPASSVAATQREPGIEVLTQHRYNPNVDYPLFMVPGILAVLVTMVGAFLSALNIVQEKESGTIEQINVTPIRKYQFILGKLVPFWLLGMISVTLGMVVALLAFGLVPQGSVFTVYLFAALYLVGVLGIGLFVSTITETQQQATLLSFFLMMVFVLLGGLYTPIESMPTWARYLAALNPPSYFVAVIRAVYIKGSTICDLLPVLLKLIAFAIVFNTAAVWSYRKRSA